MAKPQGLGKKYLEFDVDPEGSVTTEAHGFEGKTCLKATDGYEKALGLVQQRTVKTEPVKEKQRLRQGD